MADQTTQLLERIADALEQLAGSNDSQGWQQPKSVQAVFLSSRASGAIGYTLDEDGCQQELASKELRGKVAGVETRLKGGGNGGNPDDSAEKLVVTMDCGDAVLQVVHGDCNCHSRPAAGRVERLGRTTPHPASDAHL